MKMMTLFSMLFGAGLVFMGERSDQRGASLRGIYYRRCLWLLVIGLVHSYLHLVRRHPGDVRRVRPDHLPVPAVAAPDADPRGRRLPLRAGADRGGLRGGIRLPRKYGEEGGGRGKGRQPADAVSGVDLSRRVEAQDPPR